MDSARRRVADERRRSLRCSLTHSHSESVTRSAVPESSCSVTQQPSRNLSSAPLVWMQCSAAPPAEQRRPRPQWPPRTAGAAVQWTQTRSLTHESPKGAGCSSTPNGTKSARTSSAVELLMEAQQSWRFRNCLRHDSQKGNSIILPQYSRLAADMVLVDFTC